MWQGTKIFTPEDYYNYHELNRIEENIDFLMQSLGIGCYLYTLQSMSSIPTASNLNKVEITLNQIATQWFKPMGWIECKTDWKGGDIFDYRDANRLEENLASLYKLYQSNVLRTKFCGTLNAGEMILE